MPMIMKTCAGKTMYEGRSISSHLSIDAEPYAVKTHTKFVNNIPNYGLLIERYGLIDQPTYVYQIETSVQFVCISTIATADVDCSVAGPNGRIRDSTCYIFVQRRLSW